MKLVYSLTFVFALGLGLFTMRAMANTKLMTCDELAAGDTDLSDVIWADFIEVNIVHADEISWQNVKWQIGKKVGRNNRMFNNFFAMALVNQSQLKSLAQTFKIKNWPLEASPVRDQFLVSLKLNEPHGFAGDLLYRFSSATDSYIVDFAVPNPELGLPEVKSRPLWFDDPNMEVISPSTYFIPGIDDQ